MKKIIILTIALFFIFGCEQPTELEMTIYSEPEPGEEIQTLSGQWLRQDLVITFFDNGTFTFHDYYTLDELYYGFYIDYGDSVYLEVYEDGACQTYSYQIVDEQPDIILRWKSAGMVNTVDYVLID